MKDDKRDFFVSYNKADKQWAKWIAAVLENTKKNEDECYTCYLQAWDFRKGDNFVLDMQKALLKSDRMIAVLSKDYLNSEYCQPEWAAAFTKDPSSKKRILIPVRISDVKPDGLLAAINYIDLFGMTEDIAEKALINGVDINDIPRIRPVFPGMHREQFPGSASFKNLIPTSSDFSLGGESTLEKTRTLKESLRDTEKNTYGSNLINDYVEDGKPVEKNMGANVQSTPSQEDFSENKNNASYSTKALLSETNELLQKWNHDHSKVKANYSYKITCFAISPNGKLTAMYLVN